MLSTRILLDFLGWPGRVLTAGGLPARTERSERLADLTAAAGAGTYLCGTGGVTYLDPAPFAARGIAVTPFLPPAAGIWAPPGASPPCGPWPASAPSALPPGYGPSPEPRTARSRGLSTYRCTSPLSTRPCRA
ncbi:WbqC family protein [Streptomyces sp. NPDC003023]|uniref:WbqC family protein n=1 Tax=Streptomyces sp. NPDC003023 TaxID=3364675 RepID=UPI00367894E3